MIAARLEVGSHRQGHSDRKEGALRPRRTEPSNKAGISEGKSYGPITNDESYPRFMCCVSALNVGPQRHNLGAAAACTVRLAIGLRTASMWQSVIMFNCALSRRG